MSVSTSILASCCATVIVVWMLLLPSTATTALVAEVKELNGAPALFVNNKPHTGLMFWTVKPVGKATVQKGRLELSARVGSQGIKSRRLKSNRFVVEATAVMQVGYIRDASIGIKAMEDERTCYYLGLGYYEDGNRFKFWKATPQTDWQCWFTPRWDWQLNQPHQLRLVVDGERICAYMDGKLVAEKVDTHPLKPSYVTLEAYQCSGYFENIRILSMRTKVS